MTKVLISLDDRLLAQIDRAARAAGMSRSAYMAQLAQREIDRSKARSARLMEDAFTALDRLFQNAPPGDATQEIREMRDTR